MDATTERDSLHSRPPPTSRPSENIIRRFASCNNIRASVGHVQFMAQRLCQQKTIRREGKIRLCRHSQHINEFAVLSVRVRFKEDAMYGAQLARGNFSRFTP